MQDIAGIKDLEKYPYCFEIKRVGYGEHIADDSFCEYTPARPVCAHFEATF